MSWIFGQLAAGTFHPAKCGVAHRREAARKQRALDKRGAMLQRQGRADSATSERAADFCRRSWLARTVGGEMPMTDAVPCSALELARICDVLDELSAAWTLLGIGQALTLHWPEAGREARRGRATELAAATEPAHTNIHSSFRAVEPAW